MPTLAQIVTPTGVEPAFDLATYYPIFLYLVVVIGFAVAAMVVAAPDRAAARSRRSSRCPTSRAWTRSATPGMQFDVKFYLIAILFLVFDVELLFLYPWAVIAYRDGGDAIWRAAFGRDRVRRRSWSSSPRWPSAYVYAWRKGVFQWR